MPATGIPGAGIIPGSLGVTTIFVTGVIPSCLKTAGEMAFLTKMGSHQAGGEDLSAVCVDKEVLPAARTNRKG